MLNSSPNGPSKAAVIRTGRREPAFVLEQAVGRRSHHPSGPPTNLGQVESRLPAALRESRRPCSGRWGCCSASSRSGPMRRPPAMLEEFDDAQPRSCQHPDREARRNGHLLPRGSMRPWSSGCSIPTAAPSSSLLRREPVSRVRDQHRHGYRPVAAVSALACKGHDPIIEKINHLGLAHNEKSRPS